MGKHKTKKTNKIDKLFISKKWASVVLTGTLAFTLVGCGINDSKSEPVESESTIETPVEEENAIMKEIEKVDGSNAVEAAITVMIDGAQSLVDATNEYKQTEEYQNAKEQVKSNFDTILNFLSNKEAINGYTISDVSDSTISKAKDALHFLDSYIESHFPDYKETIKEKLSAAGSWLWDKSTDIGADLKEKGSQWLDELEEKAATKQRK